MQGRDKRGCVFQPIARRSFRRFLYGRTTNVFDSVYQLIETAGNLVVFGCPAYRCLPCFAVLGERTKVTLSVGADEHTNCNNDFTVDFMKCIERFTCFHSKVSDEAITSSMELSEKFTLVV